MANAVTNFIATNAKRESSVLAAAGVALGTLQQTGTIDVLSLIPDKYHGAAVAVAGILALILRNARTGGSNAP